MDLMTQAAPADWQEQWRGRVREQMVRLRTGHEADNPEENTDRALMKSNDEGHEVWRFREDGADIGSIWVVRRPTGMQIWHLDLPEDRVDQAWQLVESVAQERGWESLEFTEYHGDVVAAALRRATHADLVATKMSIAVADVPDSTVELRRMTPERFERFLSDGVEEYAHAIFGAGRYDTLDDARVASAKEHDSMFPNGEVTRGHLVWSAFDREGAETEVGVLWIEMRFDHGFIYDIAVDPQQQRKGYGTQMLRAGAGKVRDAGRTHLWLNVFGHNADARRLYEREGYAVDEQFWRAPVTQRS